MSVQTLKLLVCNDCVGTKSAPYRSITILIRHCTYAGWTIVPSQHPEGRTKHYCPACSRRKASK